jgi:hypothetical protein
VIGNHSREIAGVIAKRYGVTGQYVRQIRRGWRRKSG